MNNSSKIFFLIGLIATLAYGCTKTNAEPVVLDTDIPTRDSLITVSNSDTIVIYIQEGLGSLKIHKEKRQHINLKFDSQDYTEMTAKLSSEDTTANIRFVQIEMPDGNMDGPFGDSMSYTLPVKGEYLLVIHENQMAGEPWSGDFEVNISLSK